MFLIVHDLCLMYAGLDPLCVQQKAFAEVMDLYCDVRRMQIRENRKKAAGDNQMIRRRASDDAGWW